MRRSWLAVPYLAGLCVLVVVPMVLASWLAFTEYYGFEAPTFTGFDNLRRAIDDDRFWDSVWVACLLALIIVPLRLVLATGCALLLHRRRRGAAVGRVSAYLPSVIPDAAWALLWLWLLNPLYGPVALGSEAVGLPGPGFLTDPWATRVGLAVMLSLQLGEAFIVALAARRMIPDRHYEMAALEGASAFYATRRITAVSMAPLLGLLAVRDFIVVLQVTFIPVLLVTEGGPRSTTTTSPVYIYERAFLYGELGYASMLSLVLLVLTSAVIAGQFVLLRRLRFDVATE